MLGVRNALLLCLVSSLLATEGRDKYTDESRPYEFGFTIDGEQHRHEKKDENGLIMGEYGFITADGVYHVTAYATDENGNFRILSMKNIRVRPFPTSGDSSRQGHSLAVPQSPQGAPPPPEPRVQRPAAAPVAACSSCTIPASTPPPQNPASVFIRTQSNPQYPQQSQSYPQSGDNAMFSVNRNYPQAANGAGGSNQNYQPQTETLNNPPTDIYDDPNYAPPPESQNSPPQANGDNNPNYPQQPEPINYPQTDVNNRNYAPQPEGQLYPQQVNDVSNQNYPQQPQTVPNGAQNAPNQVDDPYDLGIPDTQKDDEPQGTSGDRNPKQLTATADTYPLDGSEPVKPRLISAQMNIVDGDTAINFLAPGEEAGLPAGLTQGDLERIMYVFNYTVGFHGHYEEGLVNGNKRGYYYVTGRDGVRTRVDYEADENGFRPKITKEVLDLISDEVPKPETEKQDKYGLKSYEFKWLYYPVESRKIHLNNYVRMTL